MAHHESEPMPNWLDNSEWSAPKQAPDSGLLHFERLLNFSVPGNDADIHNCEPKPSKPLACVRCHAQKLRCVRKSADVRTCDRCQNAEVECTSRQLRRMGRPVEHHNNNKMANGTRSKHKLQKKANGARNRGSTDGSARPPLVGSEGGSEGGTSTWSPLSTGRPVSRQDSDGNHITASSISSNDNDIFMDVEVTTHIPGGQFTNGSSNSNSSNPTTQLTPSSYVASDMDMWSSWPSPAKLTSYTDSLIAGFDGSISSFPNFEDLSGSLFPQGMDIGGFGESHNLNNSNSRSPRETSPDDPVEQLSKFQIELYQCLTSVKVVEKLKKQKLRDMTKMSKEVEEIDTTWLQDLFQTSERFIEALTGFVSNTLSITVPTNTAGDSREVQESNATIEVDTATGLMIVSCYMRLLQILEVVVFIVETYRDFDCPGTYVEIRFGSFIPKTDKALSARLLGQYVLHLLDGISEAVDKAIASRQPYARAIADTRRVEGKLKERISTALH
ncbi:hypothetical protein GLAREA_08451 [Glarea lozoyensis ATCC 20868]|uniref:Zn(2)-C6 fungal-type domain-containing protein n=1 Tax=Glarea lozoyensis (strain ATCC 20868 / MF5171) TaxID=1116229 RepID=S3DD27_GLAL2|nr:uncharacterized protein GLAREA_08451 [Glarea lozoyensis ATCC 20868]EPE24598.1 hypothetical protein GLAREA_08451 [Glarea lozoyensis ATCC 20868]